MRRPLSPDSQLSGARPFVRFGAPVVLALALSACPDKTDEPDSAHRAQTATSGSASAPVSQSSDPDAGPSPAAKGKYSPRELHDFNSKISNELCQTGAKHLNQVNKRPDFDPKGINTIAACLELGNLAWYRCIIDTETPEAFTACSHRYLIPRDEIPH